MEQQLWAIDDASRQVKDIPGGTPVTVRTQDPTAEWLKETFQKPKSGHAQVRTRTKWRVC